MMYQRQEIERYNQMLRPAVQYIQSVKATLSNKDFNLFLMYCRNYITQSSSKDETMKHLSSLMQGHGDLCDRLQEFLDSQTENDKCNDNVNNNHNKNNDNNKNNHNNNHNNNNKNKNNNGKNNNGNNFCDDDEKGSQK